MGHNLESGRCLLNIIVMAHPANILVRQSRKEIAGGIQIHQGLAIFPLRGLADLTAQHMHHQLAAIANSQNRNTPGINLGVNGGRIREICTVGAAGKDDALGIFGLDFGQIGAVRVNFAIHVAFADAAGNQLVILAAEIQDDDRFLLHKELLS